jgi:hypothetical protein
MEIYLARRRAISYTAVVIGLAVGISPGRAQSQTLLGAMINSAGRNRMHSQRLARCYAQQSLGIDADASKRHMQESIAAISGAIEALGLTAPNANVRTALKAADDTWQKYRAQLQTPANGAQLRGINRAAEDFFAASNTLTLSLQNAANQKAAKLTDDAGAQRPRTMRLAKCFLFDLAGNALADEVRTVKPQFEAIHAELEKAPETTGAIRAQLDLVKIQFGFLASAIDGTAVDRSKFARAAVTTSERIVELMDDVVRGYALQVKV